MSNHDDYVTLNMSKDKYDNGRFFCAETQDQLGAAYRAFVDKEELMVPDFNLLQPISDKEASDLMEALRGDYKEGYHIADGDMFLLPKSRVFEERLEHSTFDNINLESNRLKFRFLTPFIIKAELKPGLAFAEVLLTIVYILTLSSVLMHGFTIMAIFVGGVSLFLLLTIVHFWYGISRYPSIWNSITPHGLKGSPIDRNFSEIRQICSHHCNGHNHTYSQLPQFLITLPFTAIYHANAFLVTLVHFVFKISRNGGIGSKLPPPVMTSVFISNILITYFWFMGTTSGIIFSACTVFFNQKAYNSLLFNRDLKDFCISLVFGNLIMIEEKIAIDEKAIALASNGHEHDIENGIQVKKAEQGEFKSMFEKPKSIFEKPVADASGSSSLPLGDSSIDRSPDEHTPPSNSSTEPLQSTLMSTIQNIASYVSGEETANNGKESKPEIFHDDSFSQQTEDMTLQYLVTVMPTTPTTTATMINVDTSEDIQAGQERSEVNTEEPHSTKSREKKFFGLSRRIFPSPRRRKSSKREFPFDERAEDELSIEFKNPSDVHIDLDDHIGTIEWRNAISESIQRFRMKSYTLRKHTWVMNQIHGKSFFIKEDGKRRRKLKRKEIKAYCKAFHDKQMHLNLQISGILEDLKDLKKNHNTKSSSDHTRRSLGNSKKSKCSSDHTKNSFINIPSEMNNGTEDFMNPLTESGGNERKSTDQHIMDDRNDQAANAVVASSTRDDSIVQSSKDSTISTLTESTDDPLEHEQENNNEDGINARSTPWITGPTLYPKDKDTVADSESSCFSEKISVLLECSPWSENMNLLRDSNSMKDDRDETENDKADDASNAPQRQNNGLKGIMKDTGHKMDGENSVGLLGGKEAYWRAFVEEGNASKPKSSDNTEETNLSQTSRDTDDDGSVIPGGDSKPETGRKRYPWRSDLQRKKIEKAREKRSHDKDLSIKKQKRIASIFKAKMKKGGRSAGEGGQRVPRSPRITRKRRKHGVYQPCDEMRHDEKEETKRWEDGGDENRDDEDDDDDDDGDNSFYFKIREDQEDFGPEANSIVEQMQMNSIAPVPVENPAEP